MSYMAFSSWGKLLPAKEAKMINPQLTVKRSTYSTTVSSNLTTAKAGALCIVRISVI